MNEYNGKNGNGYQPVVNATGKQPKPPIEGAHKCAIVDGLRYEVGALMDAAANEIEVLRKTLSAAKEESEKYYQLWQSVIRFHEEKTVPERDRLLVMATKHCDKAHHDWQEILQIAGDV